MKTHKAIVNIVVIVSLGLSYAASAEQIGNTFNDSFSKAKKLMRDKIYTTPELQKTIYCGASFNDKKVVTLPAGFTTNGYKNRQKIWEAEHVSAAESWGHTFKEWRDGDKLCIDNHGKHFKGRKCAEKANKEYRLMQSDLYNLFPAIGSVNAYRQNYNFTMLPPNTKSDFGTCDMRIDNRKVQPPERARGRIARTYLYMQTAYKRYKMSKAQFQLMTAWDKQYPVTAQECEIGRRVKAVQHSSNPILEQRCKALTSK